MLLIDKELHILDVNKSGCVLFGYDKAALQQRRIGDLLHPEDASDISPQFYKLLQGDINQYRITRRCLGEQGKTLWLNATLSAVRNHQGEIDYVVIQAQDITEQYLLSEDLNHQSLHDAMTGLPNRRALEKQLQHMLAEPTDKPHAFCYLDLDQFKVINDTCGHIAGDALLKQMTDQLQLDLCEHDFVARFSGDEFALLLANCSQEQACQRLEQLLARIRDFDFVYDGYKFKVSACIGLVMFDHHSAMVDLLKQADSACYAAKEAGRDRLHLFTETDTELVQRNGEMRWVARIQQALNDNRMVLYSQPIVPTMSHKTSLPHVELLIRMLDDDGKIITPGEFLPAAERYNLIAAIDMWTVEHVLSELQQARDQGRDIHGIYAINLSGQSLGDARFYKRIISLIKAAGLTDARAVLCFEVTETAAITNMRSALHFINELRQIGCLIALDDFGSGLSSFAYLKQMPVDYLKIDGMFVNDCVHNSVNLEIVNSINGIGQVLGLKTVAEFVEDESTLITMKHLGVDFVQGFRIGKPQPWEI
jgi:Amt family ammonium transporter